MTTATLIDMDALARTTMARPVERPGIPRGVSPRSLQVLAEMPPADDQEAGAPTPPALGLTQVDLDSIAQVARAWRDALAAATEAEQALTSAQHAAKRLPELQRDAGEAAARAYSMNGHGRALATSTVEQIDAAKLAASALPVLQRERDLAADKASRARGALHTTTTNALKAALRRAVDHYNATSLEMTRATASIEACVNALPAVDAAPMQAGWALIMRYLNVPAITSEFGPLDRGAAPDRYIPTMLAALHPRLSAHARAAQGHLDAELREALGFSPGTLLR